MAADKERWVALTIFLPESVVVRMRGHAADTGDSFQRVIADAVVLHADELERDWEILAPVPPPASVQS